MKIPIALCLLSVVSIVQAASLTPAERQFVENAAAGNTAEIKLAQLAQQKAQDSQVKDFANRMITDHGKANDNLRPIAQAANVTMPDQLKGDAKATHNELQKLSGAKFDRQYVTSMVRDHRKDAAAYRKAQATVKDPQLKAYIDNTLPVVESHLTMVEGIEKSMVKR